MAEYLDIYPFWNHLVKNLIWKGNKISPKIYFQFYEGRWTLGKHMFHFPPPYKSRNFSHDCIVVTIWEDICFRMSTILHRVLKCSAHLVSLATFFNVYWNIFSVLQIYGEEEWRNLPVLLQFCACFLMIV
jgi:hypothetical protein